MKNVIQCLAAGLLRRKITCACLFAAIFGASVPTTAFADNNIYAVPAEWRLEDYPGPQGVVACDVTP